MIKLDESSSRERTSSLVLIESERDSMALSMPSSWSHSESTGCFGGADCVLASCSVDGCEVMSN